MFRAQDMHELVTSVSYFESIVQAQRRSLGRYTVLRDSVEALRLSLDTTKNQARAERDVIVGKQADLEASRQAQDDVRQQVAADEQQKQALLDQVQSRKAEFEAQIAGLRAQSDAIGGVLRGVQSGQGPAPSGHGVLASPISGAPITSTFGPRMHPIFHEVRMHTGVDFGASAGTPIQAASDGVVVSAGPLGGYGNATVIDHGNSLATLYAHQSMVDVAAGQHVTRGQIIGLVGCTGFCTGPHLHFEVRVNGTPVDPLPYL
jgi:murein DD-endopeptidase MepM/ murein hydrolase activator NlpD